MPRNGSGTYTLPAGNPVVPGTVISSSGWANPTLNDIAAALTGSWALNGEAVPTANQSLGNFRLTNVGNAINRNEYAAYGQVQDGQPQWMTVTGTDTILGTIAPGPTGYTAGQTFRFVAVGANTTNAVTLNINSLGAKSVTKFGTIALSAGDIPNAAVVEVTYDGTQFQASKVIPPRTGYSVRGLLGANNSGTPNSKFDVSADTVTLMNQVTGESTTRRNTGTITCDFSVAGPTANGRDQAGAFSVASWVHLYFIFNGSTLATIASVAAPPTGPTLPTGYISWAYIGAVRIDGLGNIVRMHARGSFFYYDANATVLSNGTATVETAVSISNFIPPNSLSWAGYGQGAVTSDGSGIINVVQSIRIVSGSDFTNNLMAMTGLSAGAGQNYPISFAHLIPNIGQSFFYINSVTTGSSPAITVRITAYIVPNGGE